MPLDPLKPYPIRPRLRDKESYMGTRGYFITINTKNKSKIFIQPKIIDSLVKYLKKVSEKERFEIVAYCFMPNHLHLVLTGQIEASDLQFFLKHYKQITGFHFKKKFNYTLWARSFYDHVLRKEEEDIKGVGRYVLKNPVRAGIVKNVLDYPFSGSFVYDLKELVDSDPFLVSDCQT